MFFFAFTLLEFFCIIARIPLLKTLGGLLFLLIIASKQFWLS